MEEDGKIPELTGEIRNDKGQFVEGISGNPAGRPKGSYSVVEMIKNKLKEIPEGKNKTYGEYFIEQIMKKIVVEGDVTMMKDIINRIDGMPQQSVDMTTLGKEINAMSYDQAKSIITGEGSNPSDSSE